MFVEKWLQQEEESLDPIENYMHYKRREELSRASSNQSQRHAEDGNNGKHAKIIEVLVNMHGSEKNRNNNDGPEHADRSLQRRINDPPVNQLFHERSGRKGEESSYHASFVRAVY